MLYCCSVSKKLRELLKCRKCGITFRVEKSLIDHLYEEHGVNDASEDSSVNKIYRCTVSDRTVYFVSDSQ